VTLDTIAVPTEVVLWRGTLTGTQTRCIDLNAGGDLAFFTVERVDGTAISNVEVLSCGNGQYGGLGNALFSNAQGVPVRTKAVSGLLECTYRGSTRENSDQLSNLLTFWPFGSLGKVEQPAANCAACAVRSAGWSCAARARDARTCRTWWRRQGPTRLGYQL
jgi:hypothetical protein